MARFAATFEIIPRSNLSPAGLQALGKAIRLWLRHHAKHGAGVSKDRDGGLVDLLEGRPLISRLRRRIAQVKESQRLRGLPEHASKKDIRQWLTEQGDDPARRTIRVELFYLHDDRRRLIEIARERIPAELVDDLLVNGLSWRDDLSAERTTSS